MVCAASTVSASFDSAMKSGTAKRGAAPASSLLIVVLISLGCCGAAGGGRRGCCADGDAPAGLDHEQRQAATEDVFHRVY